jgi:hypothetical protein
MYPTILAIHSFFRWLVLLSLVFAIFRSYKGWLKQKVFTPFDNTVRHVTATIVHIQLMLGLTLYFISPMVAYFLNNFKTAIHIREIRFFGLEHIFTMLIAVTVITIGSIKAKRKSTDIEKFKTIAIWFSIGLFIILCSIPWAFSPLTARPYLRTF